MIDLMTEGPRQEARRLVDALLAIRVEPFGGQPGGTHRSAAVAGHRKATLFLPLLTVVLPAVAAVAVVLGVQGRLRDYQ